MLVVVIIVEMLFLSLWNSGPFSRFTARHFFSRSGWPTEIRQSVLNVQEKAGRSQGQISGYSFRQCDGIGWPSIGSEAVRWSSRADETRSGEKVEAESCNGAAKLDDAFGARCGVDIEWRVGRKYDGEQGRCLTLWETPGSQ